MLSEGERRLREIAAAALPKETVEYNVRPDWLLGRKGRPLELDIWFPGLRLALEYQGWQHWLAKGDVSMTAARVQRSRDFAKARRCHQAGVHLYGITWDALGLPLAERIRSWAAVIRSGKRPGLMQVPQVVELVRPALGRTMPIAQPDYKSAPPVRRPTVLVGPVLSRRETRIMARRAALDARCLLNISGLAPQSATAGPHPAAGTMLRQGASPGGPIPG